MSPFLIPYILERFEKRIYILSGHVVHISLIKSKLHKNLYGRYDCTFYFDFRDSTSEETRLIDDPKLKILCEKYHKSPAQVIK